MCMTADSLQEESVVYGDSMISRREGGEALDLEEEGGRRGP